MRALISAVAGAWLLLGCGPVDDVDLAGTEPVADVQVIAVEPSVPPREPRETYDIVEVTVEKPAPSAVDARLTAPPPEERYFYRVHFLRTPHPEPRPVPLPVH